MFGAAWRSAEIRSRLGQRPLEDAYGGCPVAILLAFPSLSVEERNSILSQLTEKRDRCQSPAAAIIPSATDAAHGVCLGPIGPGRSTRGSNHMMWRVGKVENIDMGSGFIPSPGFTIQQDGRSPALTIIFEDLKTAEQCASSMREIIDKATAIRGRD
ncbi:MAG TPA: hypothetical protein VFO15_18830 [Xanthobacteraceae bacterium]|nr:hypothetical protein [Xanthobacteraceae bacterium]